MWHLNQEEGGAVSRLAYHYELQYGSRLQKCADGEPRKVTNLGLAYTSHACKTMIKPRGIMDFRKDCP